MHDQLYFIPPDILQRHTPRIMEGAAMLCAHLDAARNYYAKQSPEDVQVIGAQPDAMPGRGD